MIITQHYECEICSREFEKPEMVRDEIAICNGEDSRAYAYVCAPCIKKVVQVLDENFPKSKYAKRIREAERIAQAVAA